MSFSSQLGFSGAGLISWLQRIPSGPSTIIPSGIVGPRQVYAPTLSEPRTIVPSSLIGPRNVFTPAIAGPISPPAIASRQHFFTPTFKADKTIVPSSLIGPRALYSPRVANVQTIRPTAITSPRAFFSPTLIGSPRFLNIVTLRGPRRVFTPSLSGGQVLPIRILIGGFDATKYLRFATTIIDSQTIGRWTATFDIFVNDGSYAPVIGQTVQIFDFGRLEFAGCIQSRIIDRFLSTVSSITYHISCTDKTGIMDRRVVKTKTYPTGTDIAFVILDIAENSLDGEGFTFHGVPQDGSLGVLETDLVFNFDTVTQAYDQIAEMTGTIWYCKDFDVTFDSESNLPGCPFSFTETSKNWRNLTIEESTLDYRNIQYAVSNLSALPGSGAGGGTGGGGSTNGITESFTWSPGQPGIISAGGIAEFIQTSLPIGTVTGITVDGVDQTVVNFANYSGQQSQGPDDFLWFYASSYSIGGGVQNNNQAGPTLGPITDGATIEIIYIPFSANAGALVGEVLAPLPPVGYPELGTFGTCGSGKFEAVEQVQNISSQDDLIAIATAILTKRGGIPKLMIGETDEYGAQVGALITVDLPILEVSALQFLMTSITKTSMGVDLGYGTTFRTVINNASTEQDPGNWIKWFERLIARTQNALPIYRFETAKFALVLDGSSVSGLISSNAHIVENTGLIFDMHACWSEAAIDEDLVLTPLVNGIALPYSVTIPAGSSPDIDHPFSFPPDSPFYFFARPGGPNDTVRVSASYRQTGPNPSPASNVTFMIRWRY